MQHEINYLQQLLATLRTRLLVMAASVGIALEEAGKALAANDPGRATAVMENDAAIDALENEIDEMALQLLARTQPVAGDLRFVVSALRMVVDLERIGDEAVSVAEQAVLMQDTPGCAVIPQVLPMFQRAREAYEQAVRIFRENRADEALQCIHGDGEALQCEVRIIQGIMERLSDPTSGLKPPLAMHIILITRSLTRIWRRSINIAEHVYFISQGESLKHNKLEDKTAPPAALADGMEEDIATATEAPTTANPAEV
ncbi:phosphate signaling complex protein PhoU [uncultured Desulfovibrio sp.]|uniref:phosphate signaling complex protein PhoU n=1 Tax=uncultured Desulfovibrio sp. TaxID=167968 RepID=UPI00266B53D1|nr:phosphate signaling complex protein PhoU [uncultured Desulfovibrio sp.]